MQMMTLTNEQLAKNASAIFATTPHADVSSRYSFVPTVSVIDALRTAGWRPVYAGQSIAKDMTRSGVQRHVVRLRPGHPPGRDQRCGLRHDGEERDRRSGLR